MEGSGLTTKCSSCNDIIYRVWIVEENSPTIRSAKLKKEPVMDIGYYARQREIQEILLFGSENKTKIGSGPKPVPKTDVVHHQAVVTTNFLSGSLRTIWPPQQPQPTIRRIFCPVCSATARMQPRLRPSEANLFCRYCQLQFGPKALTIDPFLMF